jgi:hypothetical protein
VLYPHGLNMSGRWVGLGFDGRIMSGWASMGQTREESEKTMAGLSGWPPARTTSPRSSPSTDSVVTSTNAPRAGCPLHTRRDRVAEIVALAKQEHPYEVPGISTRMITGGNPDYLAWIAQEKPHPTAAVDRSICDAFAGE